MQHIKIIWACSVPGMEKFKRKNLLNFLVLEGTETISGLWFGAWDQCRGWHYAKCHHLSRQPKIPKFSLSAMVANIQLSKKVSSYPSGVAGPKPLII